jgi:chemotaxis protein methyltransferase CheR
MSWYLRLAELVRRHTGIRVRVDSARDALERLVGARVRRLGLGSFDGYVALLENDGAAEWTELVNAVTVGQTAFFRDVDQLDLGARWLAQRGGARALVWCAGCATGEEAWSLAMLCGEHRVRASVLATDVNTAFLAMAERGHYDAWSLRRMSQPDRERHFVVDGDRFAVRDEVRDVVRFARHNLVRDPMPRRPGGFDLVVCRNVLMYFDDDTVARTVKAIAATLAPDGLMLLGPSDFLRGGVEGLAAELREGRVVYRPAAARPTPARPSPVARRPAVETLAKPAAPVRVDQALELALSGRLPAARRALASLLRPVPEHARGWLVLGHVCVALHAFDEAEDAYAQARALVPLAAEVHFAEGVLRRKTGEMERAAAALRSALFLAPDDWAASYLYAGVLERLGQRDRALAELRHTETLLRRPPAPEPEIRRTLGLALDPRDVRLACARRIEALVEDGRRASG